jgi:light-regulated signal transduction histidine kinase (bacteriophytochrome)
VLAVDDSVTYLHALADQLRDEGYEPILARSGQEAIDLLAAQRVDCILMDLQMPDMDGIEACRRIKATAELQRIPLIMLTGLDERSSMIAGINAGADDYIAKSADPDVFEARLRAHLRRKQFEDENRRIREELLRRDTETRAARDLAETKAALLAQLEEKNRLLARHAAELEAVNRELEAFGYSVSHDLRQPLRAMTGFSRLLLERYGEGLDERGRHYLERVDAGARHLTDLVDGLLLLSRVGRQEIRRVPLRIDRIAATVAERLHEADPRPVNVSIQPELHASGDRQLLESVLENLVGNAWKFTRHADRPQIEIGAVAENGVAVFYVKDNGAGFDMEYAANLFGPFQRLHSAGEFEGTGIGLATVQRIVHRHGGRVWAESAPGKGASIYFTLEGESR